MNKSGIQVQRSTPAFETMFEATHASWMVYKQLNGARDFGRAQRWANARRAQGLPGILWLRTVTADNEPLSELPQLTADALVFWSGFQTLAGGGITVMLEVPVNERFHTDMQQFAQLAEASVLAATMIKAQGLTPGVLVISEGNPPGPDYGIAFFLQPRVLACMRQFRAMGAVWCPHGYSHPPDPSNDEFHSIRPQKILALLPEECRLNYGYGEDGCDGGTGQPDRKPGQGFRSYFPEGEGRPSTPRQYRDWMSAKRANVAADPLCIGSALFLDGADPASVPSWDTFDITDEIDFRAYFTENVDGPPTTWLAPTDEEEQPMPPGVPWIPPPLYGDANPWHGKILTVHECPADPAVLVSTGRRLALRGFELKVADGDSSWVDSPDRHVSLAYVEALRNDGFAVLSWSYNYCDGRVNAGDRGEGLPIAEAATAVQAAQAIGSAGHTFDLEIECEGHGENVDLMLRTARYGDGLGIPAIGIPIAAHVWATLEGHEQYPAEIICSRVDILRKMIYRAVWNAADAWASWGRRIPDFAATWTPFCCPVWGLTDAGATADVIAEDMAVADSHECPGEAYWEEDAAAVTAVSAAPRFVATRNLILSRFPATSVPPGETPEQALREKYVEPAYSLALQAMGESDPRAIEWGTAARSTAVLFKRALGFPD